MRIDCLLRACVYGVHAPVPIGCLTSCVMTVQGKRVAVIGTGSSAVQVRGLPDGPGHAARLTIVTSREPATGPKLDSHVVLCGRWCRTLRPWWIAWWCSSAPPPGSRPRTTTSTRVGHAITYAHRAVMSEGGKGGVSEEGHASPDAQPWSCEVLVAG